MPPAAWRGKRNRVDQCDHGVCISQFGVRRRATPIVAAQLENPAAVGILRFTWVVVFR